MVLRLGTARLVLAALVVAVAGASAPTSFAVPAASGDCSIAAAQQAVAQFRLGDPEVANPVFKVLCGAFAGAGSETMVASLSGPGASTGMIDWVVFGWSGAAWTFLMKQHQAAELTAAGPDIRETVQIYRANDPRCCPSGGTKARLWHWDGTRFVATAWTQVTKGKVITQSFYSPSKNVMCSVGDSSDYLGVSCRSFAARQSVKMDATGRLKMCHGQRCFGCGCIEEGLPKLAYGKQLTVGRFRCYSLRTGMKCIVISSGKGFLINRAGVTKVG